MENAIIVWHSSDVRITIECKVGGGGAVGQGAWHDEACERRHMWTPRRNHTAHWIYWMPGKDT